MKNEVTKGLGDMFNTVTQTLKVLHDEAHEVGKTMVGAQLKAQDIVTREEFEEQKRLLAEVADKLTKIEKLI